MSLIDHDFIAASLARDTLAREQAAADVRRRLAEARRAREASMSDLITGTVALAVQPDAATIEAAWALAAELMPPAAAYALAPGSLPHVTLTQCALRDAPRARVRDLVAQLEARLRGRRILLDRVVTYGSGFLFWCTEADGPERRLLQAAHEEALALAEGALDPVANQAVIEATHRAFGGDPALVDNARRFGYSLVRERYLPHVTLGFDPRLAAEAGTGLEVARRTCTLTVERVILARLGAYGRLEAELAPA